jgi:chromosome condensin MukBEF ATPase and DNA-binding subunit MukB
MERMSEKIINDKVDGLLTKMEVYFKEAVEKHKPLQDELNDKVKALMDEFDEREETKRFQMVKDFSDYIALTISMPISEGTKERIIEELIKECEENGKETSESV